MSNARNALAHLVPPAAGQPAAPIAYAIAPPNWYGGDAEPEERPVPLSHYVWILKRHRWKILSFIVACVLATLVVSERVTPIYESDATIDVDRRMPAGILGPVAFRSGSGRIFRFNPAAGASG